MAMQEQVAYPVGMAADDSVGLTIVALGAQEGVISAIRVQDIARQIWFTWDWGVWNQNPSCLPGSNNLYVSFAAYNQGEIDGELTITLRDDTGAVLATKTEWVPVGGYVGLEWTGRMPTRNYGLTCEVVP